MRVLLALVLTVVSLALIVPRGCQGVRARVLLTLLRESERPVEIVPTDPIGFRFPATAVRAVALIDLHAAATADGHVSFLPPPGSDRYAWAAGVCPTWSAQCLDARPPATVAEITYGQVPAGLAQIEPARGAPPALRPHHLYGLALFGDKLFALKVFYRDNAGIHTMDGWRFATAITTGERAPIHAFLPQH